MFTRSEAKEPCPFCGCEMQKNVLGPEESTNKKGFQIECFNCGARGPCGMATPKDAALAWDYGDFGFTRTEKVGRSQQF